VRKTRGLAIAWLLYVYSRWMVSGMKSSGWSIRIWEMDTNGVIVSSLSRMMHSRTSMDSHLCLGWIHHSFQLTQPFIFTLNSSLLVIPIFRLCEHFIFHSKITWTMPMKSLICFFLLNEIKTIYRFSKMLVENWRGWTEERKEIGILHFWNKLVCWMSLLTSHFPIIDVSHNVTL